jgi:hypothetical protein
VGEQPNSEAQGAAHPAQKTRFLEVSSYLYERGAVDTDISLDALSRRADVSGRINNGLSEMGFSTVIRDGVPGPR